ncbi:unnamed protein product [Euphydryas editha]|uniref:Uncharacterized protein n=1 Tax=Euphydryas editha TaxID=104508 RepID=A0AAU9VAE5_EUPED|nr:unnamed protein product [Euphydryas editha]
MLHTLARKMDNMFSISLIAMVVFCLQVKDQTLDGLQSAYAVIPIEIDHGRLVTHRCLEEIESLGHKMCLVRFTELKSSKDISREHVNEMVEHFEVRKAEQAPAATHIARRPPRAGGRTTTTPPRRGLRNIGVR